ncbi:MAG: UDP-N-acetylmuramoyl-L-alanine--D-glutamate ligase [Taibaiella sp.]|nr:UDP-N-acetylmuramoyl-L-alanine--D-glutamate ligase [Taibaiella sp.]
MSTSAKRLVILGAAESGVGAALLGIQQGWEVFVSDGGKIKPPFREVLDANEIAFEEGVHSMDKILNATCIVKSPGISDKTKLVQEVRGAGIEVCSEIEFGFRYKGDSRIIAITGSNGKSTTTMLTYNLLKDSGYDVALVGNIGYSFAGQIAKKPCEWYVMEISSFQLDDTHTFRPDVAVLLNITPDHLDRYDYKFENYVASKFRITKFQHNSDFFVVNQDDKAIQQYLASHSVNATTIFFTMNDNIAGDDGGFVNNEKIHINYEGEYFDMSIHDLTIKGKHNQYNSMAAGISARIAGVRKVKIRETFTRFKGLDHRLEYVATIRGVDFVNDSKATNVNSVWFALESMVKPTILILGGQDKGNDYTEILELVKHKVKAIICLGVNNQSIHDTFDSLVDTIIDTTSATEAVHAAYACAENGDVVLLAPACASFDRFNNFEDRGEQFKEAVRNL